MSDYDYSQDTAGLPAQIDQLTEHLRRRDYTKAAALIAVVMQQLGRILAWTLRR